MPLPCLLFFVAAAAARRGFLASRGLPGCGGAAFAVVPRLQPLLAHRAPRVGEPVRVGRAGAEKAASRAVKTNTRALHVLPLTLPAFFSPLPRPKESFSGAGAHPAAAAPRLPWCLGSSSCSPLTRRAWASYPSFWPSASAAGSGCSSRAAKSASRLTCQGSAAARESKTPSCR